MALTFLCQDIACAQGPAIPQSIVHNPQLLLPTINNSTTHLDIPSGLGKITETYKGANGKTIIHIIDTHADYKVQQNYSKILDEVISQVSNQKVLLAIEGASGSINPAILRALPSEEVKKGICEHFLKKGYLTGAEYFSVFTNSNNFIFWGVDDKELYLKNYQLFKEVQEFRERMGEFVKGTRTVLNRLEPKLLNEEQLSFITSLKQYHSHKLPITEYCKLLMQYVLNVGVSNDSVQCQSRKLPQSVIPEVLLSQTYQTPLALSEKYIPSQNSVTIAKIKPNFNKEDNLMNIPPKTPARINPWNKVRQVLLNASSLLSVQNSLDIFRRLSKPIIYVKGNNQLDYGIQGQTFNNLRSDLEYIPNIVTLLKTIQIDNRIDYNAIENERSDLIKELKGKLVKEDLEKLIEKSLLFKAGRINPLEFYNYLINISDIKSKKTYRNLILYTKLLKLYSRINHKELLQEVYRLENKLKNNLFSGTSENLANLEYNLIILKNLVDLELTREHWEYYSRHKTEFIPLNICMAVQRIDARGKLPSPPADGVEMQLLEEYYRTVLNRDQVLLQNTFAKMEEEGIKTAVLITGGFHTEGITEKLKEEGASYIVISPKGSGSEYDSPYLSVMMNEFTPYERLVTQMGKRLIANISLAERPLIPGRDEAIFNKSILSSIIERLSKVYVVEEDPFTYKRFQAEVEKLYKDIETHPDVKNNKDAIKFLKFFKKSINIDCENIEKSNGRLRIPYTLSFIGPDGKEREEKLEVVVLRKDKDIKRVILYENNLDSVPELKYYITYQESSELQEKVDSIVALGDSIVRIRRGINILSKLVGESAILEIWKNTIKRNSLIDKIANVNTKLPDEIKLQDKQKGIVEFKTNPAEFVESLVSKKEPKPKMVHIDHELIIDNFIKLAVKEKRMSILTESNDQVVEMTNYLSCLGANLTDLLNGLVKAKAVKLVKTKKGQNLPRDIDGKQIRGHASNQGIYAFLKAGEKDFNIAPTLVHEFFERLGMGHEFALRAEKDYKIWLKKGKVGEDIKEIIKGWKFKRPPILPAERPSYTAKEEVESVKGIRGKFTLKFLLAAILIFGRLLFSSGSFTEDTLSKFTSTTTPIVEVSEKTQEKVNSLIRDLEDKNQRVRELAISKLVQIGTPAVGPLIKALGNENLDVRGSAADALVQIGIPAVESLIKALGDKNPNVSRLARVVLSQIINASTTEELIVVIESFIKALGDENPDVCKAASEILDQFKKDPRAIVPFINALKDGNSAIRGYVIKALVQIGTPAVGLLIKALGHENPDVRKAASEVLGKIKDRRAFWPLIKALWDEEDRDVRKSAFRALIQIILPIVFLTKILGVAALGIGLFFFIWRKFLKVRKMTHAEHEIIIDDFIKLAVEEGRIQPIRRDSEPLVKEMRDYLDSLGFGLKGLLDELIKCGEINIIYTRKGQDLPQYKGEIIRGHAGNKGIYAFLNYNEWEKTCGVIQGRDYYESVYTENGKVIIDIGAKLIHEFFERLGKNHKFATKVEEDFKKWRKTGKIRKSVVKMLKKTGKLSIALLPPERASYTAREAGPGSYDTEISTREKERQIKIAKRAVKKFFKAHSIKYGLTEGIEGINDLISRYAAEELGYNYTEKQTLVVPDREHTLNNIRMILSDDKDLILDFELRKYDEIINQLDIFKDKSGKPPKILICRSDSKRESQDISNIKYLLNWCKQKNAVLILDDTELLVPHESEQGILDNPEFSPYLVRVVDISERIEGLLGCKIGGLFTRNSAIYEKFVNYAQNLDYTNVNVATQHALAGVLRKTLWREGKVSASIPSERFEGVLTEKAKNLKASATLKDIAIYAKDGALRLDVGASSFPLSKYLIKGAIKALGKNIKPLKKKLNSYVRNYLKQSRDLEYEEDEIIMGMGVQSLLIDALKALTKKAENDGKKLAVALATPYWPSYKAMVDFIGAQAVYPKTSEAKGFKLTAEILKGAFEGKEDTQKVIILNSPGNPTSHMYSRDELIAIGSWAVKNNAIILSDEVYGDLSTSDKEHISIASLSDECGQTQDGRTIKDLTLVFTGMSKSVAAPGLRMGWLSVTEKSGLISWIKKNHSGEPDLIAIGASIGMLRNYKKFKKYVKKHAEFCKKNKEILERFLNESGFEYIPSDGGVFLFVKVSDKFFGKYWNGEKITEENFFGPEGILYRATGISHVKGESFGMPGYVRFCIATDDVREAVKRLRSFYKSISKQPDEEDPLNSLASKISEEIDKAGIEFLRDVYKTLLAFYGDKKLNDYLKSFGLPEENKLEAIKHLIVQEIILGGEKSDVIKGLMNVYSYRENYFKNFVFSFLSIFLFSLLGSIDLYVALFAALSVPLILGFLSDEFLLKRTDDYVPVMGWGIAVWIAFLCSGANSSTALYIACFCAIIIPILIHVIGEKKFKEKFHGYSLISLGAPIGLFISIIVGLPPRILMISLPIIFWLIEKYGKVKVSSGVLYLSAGVVLFASILSYNLPFFLKILVIAILPILIWKILEIPYSLIFRPYAGRRTLKKLLSIASSPKEGAGKTTGVILPLKEWFREIANLYQLGDKEYAVKIGPIIEEYGLEKGIRILYNKRLINEIGAVNLQRAIGNKGLENILEEIGIKSPDYLIEGYGIGDFSKALLLAGITMLLTTLISFYISSLPLILALAWWSLIIGSAGLSLIIFTQLFLRNLKKTIAFVREHEGKHRKGAFAVRLTIFAVQIILVSIASAIGYFAPDYVSLALILSGVIFGKRILAFADTAFLSELIHRNLNYILRKYDMEAVISSGKDGDRFLEVLSEGNNRVKIKLEQLKLILKFIKSDEYQSKETQWERGEALRRKDTEERINIIQILKWLGKEWVGEINKQYKRALVEKVKEDIEYKRITAKDIVLFNFAYIDKQEPWKHKAAIKFLELLIEEGYSLDMTKEDLKDQKGEPVIKQGPIEIPTEYTITIIESRKKPEGFQVISPQTSMSMRIKKNERVVLYIGKKVLFSIEEDENSGSGYAIYQLAIHKSIENNIIYRKLENKKWEIPKDKSVGLGLYSLKISEGALTINNLSMEEIFYKKEIDISKQRIEKEYESVEYPDLSTIYEKYLESTGELRIKLADKMAKEGDRFNNIFLKKLQDNPLDKDALFYFKRVRDLEMFYKIQQLRMALQIVQKEQLDSKDSLYCENLWGEETQFRIRRLKTVLKDKFSQALHALDEVLMNIHTGVVIYPEYPLEQIYEGYILGLANSINMRKKMEEEKVKITLYADADANGTLSLKLIKLLRDNDIDAKIFSTDKIKDLHIVYDGHDKSIIGIFDDSKNLLQIKYKGKCYLPEPIPDNVEASLRDKVEQLNIFSDSEKDLCERYCARLKMQWHSRKTISRDVIADNPDIEIKFIERDIISDYKKDEDIEDADIVIVFNYFGRLFPEAMRTLRKNIKDGTYIIIGNVLPDKKIQHAGLQKKNNKLIRIDDLKKLDILKETDGEIMHWQDEKGRDLEREELRDKVVEKLARAEKKGMGKDEFIEFIRKILFEQGIPSEEIERQMKQLEAELNKNNVEDAFIAFILDRAIIEGPERYILDINLRRGRSTTGGLLLGGLYLAEDVLRYLAEIDAVFGTRLVLGYILHAIKCKGGKHHYKVMDEQRTKNELLKVNYEWSEGLRCGFGISKYEFKKNKDKGWLKYALRGFINKGALVPLKKKSIDNKIQEFKEMNVTPERLREEIAKRPWLLLISDIKRKRDLLRRIGVKKDKEFDEFSKIAIFDSNICELILDIAVSLNFKINNAGEIGRVYGRLDKKIRKKYNLSVGKFFRKKENTQIIKQKLTKILKMIKITKWGSKIREEDLPALELFKKDRKKNHKVILGMLTEKEREVIRLRLKGKKVNEIAKILEKNSQVEVSIIQKRAIQKLNYMVEEPGSIRGWGIGRKGMNKTFSKLYKLGIKTVKDLCSKTRKELSSIVSHKKSLDNVELILKEMGKTLREPSWRDTSLGEKYPELAEFFLKALEENNEEILKNLTPIEILILKKRLLEGLKHEEIAVCPEIKTVNKKEKLTRERIRQIESDALEKLALIMINRIEKKYWKNEIEYQQTEWEKALGKKVDSSAILRRRQGIFLNNDYYRTIQEGLKIVKDPILKRRIELLNLDFMLNRILARPEISKIKDTLTDKINEFRFKVAGEEIKRSELVAQRSKTSKAGDVKATTEVISAEAQLGKEFASLYREYIKALNKAAQEYGYKNFYELKCRLEGFDPAWLKEALAGLYEATKKPYNEFIKEAQRTFGKDLNMAKLVIIINRYLPDDTLFPEDELKKKLEDYFVSIGFPKDIWDKIKIVVTGESRSVAKMIPVNPLAKKGIRMLFAPLPGIRSYHNAFHEALHCIHSFFAALGQKSFILNPKDGSDYSYGEGIADFGLAVVNDPGWLKENMNLTEDQIKKVQQSYFCALPFIVRNTLAQTIFEQKVYENPNQDFDKLWLKLQKRYLLIDDPKTIRWSANLSILVDYPGIFYSYSLSPLIAAWLQKYVRDNIDGKIYGDPRIGEFFKSIFEPGRTYPWREVLEKATGGRKITKESLTEAFKGMLNSVDWKEIFNTASDREEHHTVAGTDTSGRIMHWQDELGSDLKGDDLIKIAHKKLASVKKRKISVNKFIEEYNIENVPVQIALRQIDIDKENIFLYDAIVEGDERYVLDMYVREDKGRLHKGLYLSEDIIKYLKKLDETYSLNLFGEYIYHTINCEGENHDDVIKCQKTAFGLNYIWTEDLEKGFGISKFDTKKGWLKHALRKFITVKARDRKKDVSGISPLRRTWQLHMVPFLAAYMLSFVFITPKVHLYSIGYNAIQVIMWRSWWSFVILGVFYIVGWRLVIKKEGWAKVWSEIKRDKALYVILGLLQQGLALPLAFLAMAVTSPFNVLMFISATVIIVMFMDSIIKSSIGSIKLPLVGEYKPEYPTLAKIIGAVFATVSIMTALGVFTGGITLSPLAIGILVLVDIFFGAGLIYARLYKIKRYPYDATTSVTFSSLVALPMCIFWAFVIMGLHYIFPGVKMFYGVNVLSVITPIASSSDWWRMGLVTIVSIMFYILNYQAPKYEGAKPTTILLYAATVPLFVILNSWLIYGMGVEAGTLLIGAVLFLFAITIYNYGDSFLKKVKKILSKDSSMDPMMKMMGMATPREESLYRELDLKLKRIARKKGLTSNALDINKKMIIKRMEGVKENENRLLQITEYIKELFGLKVSAKDLERIISNLVKYLNSEKGFEMRIFSEDTDGREFNDMGFPRDFCPLLTDNGEELDNVPTIIARVTEENGIPYINLTSGLMIKVTIPVLTQIVFHELVLRAPGNLKMFNKMGVTQEQSHAFSCVMELLFNHKEDSFMSDRIKFILDYAKEPWNPNYIEYLISLFKYHPYDLKGEFAKTVSKAISESKVDSEVLRGVINKIKKEDYRGAYAKKTPGDNVYGLYLQSIENWLKKAEKIDIGKYRSDFLEPVTVSTKPGRMSKMRVVWNTSWYILKCSIDKIIEEEEIGKEEEEIIEGALYILQYVLNPAGGSSIPKSSGIKDIKINIVPLGKQLGFYSINSLPIWEVPYIENGVLHINITEEFLRQADRYAILQILIHPILVNVYGYTDSDAVSAELLFSSLEARTKGVSDLNQFILKNTPTEHLYTLIKPHHKDKEGKFANEVIRKITRRKWTEDRKFLRQVFSREIMYKLLQDKGITPQDNMTKKQYKAQVNTWIKEQPSGFLNLILPELSRDIRKLGLSNEILDKLTEYEEIIEERIKLWDGISSITQEEINLMIEGARLKEIVGPENINNIIQAIKKSERLSKKAEKVAWDLHKLDVRGLVLDARAIYSVDEKGNFIPREGAGKIIRSVMGLKNTIPFLVSLEQDMPKDKLQKIVPYALVMDRGDIGITGEVIYNEKLADSILRVINKKHPVLSRDNTYLLLIASELTADAEELVHLAIDSIKRDGTIPQRVMLKLSRSADILFRTLGDVVPLDEKTTEDIKDTEEGLIKT